ncbi:hypothetical protein [Raoultella ornithinolytica]|uniref:hypothetical protein n=1 Tax=Raoultella ornithinolytica TaxID=54291 RepID=UPI000A518DE5|nr:hypothetical protein [Raoultella ornithinolytica]
MVYLGVIIVFSGLIRINGFSVNPHINQSPSLLLKWGLHAQLNNVPWCSGYLWFSHENCLSLQDDISDYFILGFIMSTQASLEILLAWLEDNVQMETDIIFADDIDSAAMIPAVQAAIELAKDASCGDAKDAHPVCIVDNGHQTTIEIHNQGNSIDTGKALQIAEHIRKLMDVTHKQVVKDALDASSDFLDTDCVMDRLGISYSDAELRTSGALELHNALLGWASE